MKAYSQEFVATETTHKPLQVTTETHMDDENTNRLVTIITPVIIAPIFLILCITCCYIQTWYRRRKDQSLYCTAMDSISPWKQTNSLENPNKFEILY